MNTVFRPPWSASRRCNIGDTRTIPLIPNSGLNFSSMNMRIVTTSKLADAIGITRTRVYQLRKSGIIPELTDMSGRRIRNAHPLWQAVAGYAQFKSASRYHGRPSVGERGDDVQSIFDFVQ
jgi:hypothetical protein